MNNRKKTISIRTLFTMGIATVSLMAIILNSTILFNLMKQFIKNFSNSDHQMHMGRMSNSFIFDEIFDDGQTLGEIINSEIIKNMFISFLFAIILALIVGAIVSRFMSKSLKETSDMAKALQAGEDTVMPKTSIKEIQAVNYTLKDFDNKLKLKATARKSLVDQLAHEARTPLTILNSQIEALQDGIIEPDDIEYEICKDQIKNLVKLISNMGSLIETTNEHQKLELTRFSLNELINQIVAGLKAQYIKKNVHLILNECENDISLSTDKALLSQSILNVLMNAYKFTNSGDSVTIKYGIENNMAYITIMDTGIGIPSDDLDDIFKPYYRSSAVSEIKGTGLGLYIVNNNIDQLGGSIDINSVIDTGTNVTIKIPMS
ncbi:MAG: HAMP domain-containing histidine kinase [Peptostreptococcaceae bacterium]|nr:HAMP domain-containing histidine kinase [Peptostreptococcaceae bacterium]